MLTVSYADFAVSVVIFLVTIAALGYNHGKFVGSEGYIKIERLVTLASAGMALVFFAISNGRIAIAPTVIGAAAGVVVLLEHALRFGRKFNVAFQQATVHVPPQFDQLRLEATAVGLNTDVIDLIECLYKNTRTIAEKEVIASALRVLKGEIDAQHRGSAAGDPDQDQGADRD